MECGTCLRLRTTIVSSSERLSFSRIRNTETGPKLRFACCRGVWCQTETRRTIRSNRYRQTEIAVGFGGGYRTTRPVEISEMSTAETPRLRRGKRRTLRKPFVPHYGARLTSRFTRTLAPRAGYACLRFDDLVADGVAD